MVNWAPLSPSTLEALAHLCGNLPIGERETTGRELQRYLAQAGLPNPTPGITKWEMVYNAFAMFQNEHQLSNNIINFVAIVYNPCRFTEHLDVFKDEVAKLNKILLMCGLEFREDGKMHKTKAATSISDAVARAQRLRAKLQERGVHPIILKFAEKEIATENYFHTVLEAMKSVTAVVREKSLLCADGSELVDAAFFGKSPQLLINNYQTESEKSEQKGFGNLLKGLYSTFRNPTAHEAKILWHLPEEDALDVLCILSYVHRKLEHARRA